MCARTQRTALAAAMGLLFALMGGCPFANTSGDPFANDPNSDDPNAVAPGGGSASGDPNAAFVGLSSTPAAVGTGRFDLWKKPGFFRGANMIPYGIDHSPALLTGEREMTAADVAALRAAGANFVQLSLPGIWRETSPYGVNSYDVDSENLGYMDQMVAWAEQAGLYYTIAVRIGPGRVDVAEESESNFSTLWEDATLSGLYGDMLVAIVERYQANTHFVGLAPFVEPTPFALGAPQAHTVSGLRTLMNQRGFSLKTMYEGFIQKIRAVDATLPILVQGPHWSEVHFFELVEPINDAYVVYEPHNYYPWDFTHGAGDSYPGTAWDPTTNQDEYWDKSRLRTYLQPVLTLQTQTGQPIFMGEFGSNKQSDPDTAALFADEISLFNEFGWHFAYWSFRGWDFDVEAMLSATWQFVRQSWQAKP